MSIPLTKKQVILLLLAGSLVLAGVGMFDVDNDGLSNFNEWQVGTQTFNPDTDGDGLQDGSEIKKYDSDPNRIDTDNDCLNDSEEVRVGTNLSVADSDGDGLSDGVEQKATNTLPSADPLHKDIYVEVDYMSDYQLSNESRTRMKEEFASAPVSNPDGKSGISLHIIHDEQVQYSSLLNGTEYSRLQRERFDNEGNGYYYAVMVNKVENPITDGRLNGVASQGMFAATGEHGSELYQGSTFMHELGHILMGDGVRPQGVDSSSVPFNDYPSVMNYNSPREYYGYSDGTNSANDGDDWEFIVQDMAPLDTQKIETEFGCTA